MALRIPTRIPTRMALRMNPRGAFGRGRGLNPRWRFRTGSPFRLHLHAGRALSPGVLSKVPMGPFQTPQNPLRTSRTSQNRTFQIFSTNVLFFKNPKSSVLTCSTCSGPPQYTPLRMAPARIGAFGPALRGSLCGLQSARIPSQPNEVLKGDHWAVFDKYTNMTWVVYVLVDRSCSRTYVGCTKDPSRRLLQHNGMLQRGAKCTRSGRPWRVVYTEPAEDQSSAQSREWRLKRDTAFRRSLLSARTVTGLV